MRSHVMCVNFAMLSTTEMATGEPRIVGRALDSQRLFSWGANSYGQLATGDSEDTAIPNEIQIGRGTVKSISGGGGHTLVILEDGSLLVCGSNEKGQLGLGSTENVHVLTSVKALKGEIIKKAVGGWDFTLVLNDKGNVYVFGSNNFGQLGLPDLSSKFITHPMDLKLPGVSTVTDIAAGLRHGLALTDTGQIYTWGRRKANKQKNKTIDPSPVIVTLPSDTKGKIIKITAGSYFFAALSDCGEIICWGENNYGQLGISPDKSKEVMIPHIIPSKLFDGKVTDIQTGWTHVIATTEKKTVYSWGRANYGQLGRKVDHHYDYTPQPISDLDGVTCIQCGSEHNMALTDEGKLITWGWNEHGLCGHGNEDNVVIPQQVAALKDHVIKSIGCGCGHSFALTDPT